MVWRVGLQGLAPVVQRRARWSVERVCAQGRLCLATGALRTGALSRGNTGYTGFKAKIGGQRCSTFNVL